MIVPMLIGLLSTAVGVFLAWVMVYMVSNKIKDRKLYGELPGNPSVMTMFVLLGVFALQCSVSSLFFLYFGVRLLGMAYLIAVW